MSVRRGMSVRAVTSCEWKSSPMNSWRRMLTSSTALGEMSMPTHLRPSFSAATQAVAHPQNGSSTMSPGLELVSMIRSSNASGFWVGYPIVSFPLAGEISVQTSLKGRPRCSSRYRLYLGVRPGAVCIMRPLSYASCIRSLVHLHTLVTPINSYVRFGRSLFGFNKLVS